jgi:AraC-like DNA-binding protein
MSQLLELVSRHAGACGPAVGVAETAIPGLSTVRAVEPSGLLHAVSRPLVCLVVQGSKQVTMGNQAFEFTVGDSLLITADVPTVSRITRASVAAPYLSLVLELDLSVIAKLATEMPAQAAGQHAAIRVEPTEAEVVEAAVRLMHLLGRPAAIPVLSAQLLREMHYWLLVGQHGAAIRKLWWPDGHAQRISRAVALLRNQYNRPLPVEELASVAGMSMSSFHEHFRAMTSLSPLQFQKHLRLIEARRLMLSDGVAASQAAFTVGYESVHQFTREYGRMFGLPPVRDVKAARERTLLVA